MRHTEDVLLKRWAVTDLLPVLNEFLGVSLGMHLQQSVRCVGGVPKSEMEFPELHSGSVAHEPQCSSSLVACLTLLLHSSLSPYSFKY